jgi:nucleoside-diphosphate-sugar epimerase
MFLFAKSGQMTGNKIINEDLNQIVRSSLNWYQLSGKTILITGANGLLPAYMIETILFLCEKGKLKKTKVLALIRSIDKAKNRFKDYLNNKNLEFIIQDVCDPLLIDRKVDFIIHAASQASPKYYDNDPIGTLKANIIGTINLLELAKKNSVESFLYFSSSEVYGKVDEQKLPTSESDFGYLDPLNIRSCYAESKRMGETICGSWFHQSKIPVKIVRPFHSYGPGLDLNDGRIYADFISDIVNNRNIILKSDGSTRRTFCYLSDATIAFFLVLLSGKNGEAYNVGNPDCEVSIFELGEILTSLFPEKKLRIENIVIQGARNNNSIFPWSSPDISKIKNLGWLPSTSIKEGFSRTILSYE